jgi:hypothetical protein
MANGQGQLLRCASGHSGVLCATCQSGHHKAPNEACIPCETSDAWKETLGVGLALLGFVFAVWRLLASPKCPPALLKLQIRVAHFYTEVARTKLKLAVSFYQGSVCIVPNQVRCSRVCVCISVVVLIGEVYDVPVRCMTCRKTLFAVLIVVLIADSFLTHMWSIYQRLNCSAWTSSGSCNWIVSSRLISAYSSWSAAALV